jgi:hypothetical protein
LDYQIRSEWNKTIQFLKDQEDQRLDWERQLSAPLQPPECDPSLDRLVAGGLSGGQFGGILVLCLSVLRKARPTPWDIWVHQEGTGGHPRELNLREAQSTALEREVANLKALSQASSASTILEEDD